MRNILYTFMIAMALFMPATLWATAILTVHIIATPHQLSLLKMHQSVLERYTHGTYVMVDSIPFTGDTIVYQLSNDSVAFYRLSMPIVKPLVFIATPLEPVIDIRGAFEQLLSSTTTCVGSAENTCFTEMMRARNDFDKIFDGKIFSTHRIHPDARANAVAIYHAACMLNDKLTKLTTQYPATYTSQYLFPLLHVPTYLPTDSSYDALEWYAIHLLDSARYLSVSLLSYPYLIAPFTQYEHIYSYKGECTTSIFHTLFDRPMLPCIAQYLRDNIFSSFVQYGSDRCIIHLIEATGSIPFDTTTMNGRQAYHIHTLQVGVSAPLLSLPDPTGTRIALRDVATRTPYTLVVLYSHNCDHCLEALPHIHDWQQSVGTSRLSVYAVDIDPDQSAWQAFVKTKKYGFINLWLPLAEKDRVLTDYAMLGTPVLLLMNNKLKIVSRWETMEEMKKIVTK